MRKHLWLVISLLFGVAYWLGAGMIPAGALRIAVKGGGVAALAVYALRRSTPQMRPIALVLALDALGDVLIEIDLAAGVAAFAIGHMVAIGFYVMNVGQVRIGRYTRLLIIAVTFAAIGRLADHLALPADAGFAARLYLVVLVGMVLAAGFSRFCRDRVLLGAALFAASDLLLLGRMGVLAGSAVPGMLIWPLYYFGQVLIAVGVVGL